MSSPLPAGAVSAMTTVDAVRHFATGPAPATPLRAAITAACRIPEPQAVAPLLEQARMPAAWKRRAFAIPTTCWARPH